VVLNIGVPAFEKSTLLKKLNAGQYEQVPVELRRWIYAGGQVSPGLQNRRNSEIGQWSKGQFVSSLQPDAPPRISPEAKRRLAAAASAVAGASTGIGAAVSQAQAQAATTGHWTTGLIIGVLVSIALAIFAAIHSRAE